MKKIIIAALMLTGTLFAAENAPKGKYAIVLQSGAETNEAKARAVHALLYAADLAEHGHDVVLIFDGAGAGWVRELQKPENPFHRHYLRIKQLGMTQEICDYCTDVHDLQKDLAKEQEQLLVGDYHGHPSIAKWVGKGYHIIVL
ncbi:MAG TPA: DsrE family protein [Pontiella sp.]|nr:DsrE family protein [Pontiella sp.]